MSVERGCVNGDINNMKKSQNYFIHRIRLRGHGLHEATTKKTKNPGYVPHQSSMSMPLNIYLYIVICSLFVFQQIDKCGSSNIWIETWSDCQALLLVRLCCCHVQAKQEQSCMAIRLGWVTTGCWCSGACVELRPPRGKHTGAAVFPQT